MDYAIMKQTGFSLTELMVALLISSILMLGIISMFITVKKSYAIQNETAIMQDNARFVLDDVARELQKAGYFGCFGSPPAGDTTTLFPQFTENTQVGNFPKSNQITINSFNQELIVNDSSMLQGDTTILLSSNNYIWPKEGESIIVSDCDGSERYTIKSPAPNANNPTLTLNSGLTRNYSISIQPQVFMGSTKVSYQVDNNFTLYKCYDIDNDDNYCETGEIEPLVDGIEAFQIRFGIDTDNNKIPNFFSASMTGGTVVAVKIALLVRSTKRRYDLKSIDAKSYPLLDGAYNPHVDNEAEEKGYRHKFFTNTVSLQNVIFN